MRLRLRHIVVAFFALMLPGIAQTFVGGQNTIQTPVGTAGGITSYTVQLSANTSTQLAPANPNRIALEIQCDTGGVSISLTGITLSGASVSNGNKFIPANSAAPLYTPPVAPVTAVTAYTATAQACTATEYPRQ